MMPKEIVRVLNENNHDGECDWSHYAKRGEECYWSKNQALENVIRYVLSPLSAEIIARHNLQRGVLAEQDARIEQLEEHHG